MSDLNNKTSRTLLLIAGILMIIICLSGAGLCTGNFIVDGFDYSVESGIFNVLMIPTCITGVVFGAMLCAKCNRPSKKTAIATLVVASFALLLVVIFVAAGVSMEGAEFFEIPVCFGVVGLLIAALFAKGEPIAAGANASAATGKNSKEEKIALLKKLKDEGQITAAEHKELLMKELEK